MVEDKQKELEHMHGLMEVVDRELRKQYQLQEECFDNQDRRSYEHDEKLQMALHELKIIRAKVDPNSVTSGAKSTAWTPDVPSIIFGVLIGLFVAFIG
jgi:hypothetical protein